MYSFLRRPIWILSHVLIAALVCSLIGLGLWQRARYYEEKDKADRLEEKARAEAVPLDDVVSIDDATGDVPESDRYTRVIVTGTYDADAEVAILNRSQGGAPGAWVLTPLVQADGTAVPVVRGWIPYDPTGETPPFPDSVPPEGQVTVTGNLQLTQERGSLGSVDAEDGTLTSLARVDLDRLAQQLPYDLEPAWVVLDAQDPAQPDSLPQPIEIVTSDSSQNFSYMVQWWIFALTAAAGYPLVLRMVARNRAKQDQVPVDAEDPVPSAVGER
ncbi:MAG: SURF1 family protein [Actinomycetota bacterium]|nr:SURF1 family protein [Actinomycetota bacterium]